MRWSDLHKSSQKFVDLNLPELLIAIILEMKILILFVSSKGNNYLESRQNHISEVILIISLTWFK